MILDFIVMLIALWPIGNNSLLIDKEATKMYIKKYSKIGLIIIGLLFIITFPFLALL